MNELTPDQIFEQLPRSFNADKAGNTRATYQFNLSGEGGGAWWVKVDNGTATSGKGEAEHPNVTMSCSADDYRKIAQGKMNPTVAFMQGKLKIQGDMALATKLASMFSLAS